MARIKIDDLPVLEELDVKETKGIFGGALNVYDKNVLTEETLYEEDYVLVESDLKESDDTKLSTYEDTSLTSPKA